MDDLKADHLLGPESFYCPRRQALSINLNFFKPIPVKVALYDVVKIYHLTGKELLDLYCGVGSIGLYLSMNVLKSQ